MPPFSVSKPVGADRKIAPRDTLTLKSALHRLGFYDPPEWGLTDIADMAMIDGLKRFQSKNGLSADEVMKLGGPTERLLKATLREEQAGVSGATLQLGLGASVAKFYREKPWLK